MPPIRILVVDDSVVIRGLFARWIAALEAKHLADLTFAEVSRSLRALSATYLAQKIEKATAVLRSLEKKGFVGVEDVAAERDPLRAGASRLRVEFTFSITTNGTAILTPAPKISLSSTMPPGSHSVRS